MSKVPRQKLCLGTTKSISGFMVTDLICALIEGNHFAGHLLMDSTQVLLGKLNRGSLDIAIIAGNFDKRSFNWRKKRTELFVGVCSKDSPLTGQEPSLEKGAVYHLLLR